MAINSGVYAADRSFRVTVVDGSSHVGLYAADGSFNVIQESSYTGVYHPPSGALRVTLTTGPVGSIYAPDGSLYVSVDPYVYRTQPVTVVSGSFGPPPSGNYYVWLFF